MGSSNARTYGNLVEQKVIDNRNLRYRDTEMRDFSDAYNPRTNQPVEIKATSTSRANNRKGSIRLWKSKHEKLHKHNGYYVIAAYKPVGRGIRIIQSRSMKPNDIERLNPSWYPNQHTHDKNRQYDTEIPIDRILTV